MLICCGPLKEHEGVQGLAICFRYLVPRLKLLITALAAGALGSWVCGTHFTHCQRAREPRAYRGGSCLPPISKPLYVREY